MSFSGQSRRIGRIRENRHIFTPLCSLVKYGSHVPHPSKLNSAFAANPNGGVTGTCRCGSSDRCRNLCRRYGDATGNRGRRPLCRGHIDRRSRFRKTGRPHRRAGLRRAAVFSYLLSREDLSPKSGPINCVISIAAILASTYLALKNQSAMTALHEAQTELAHANRVTAMGELTAAIVHEVNQPIAGVVANADAAMRWLVAQPPDLEEARQALEGIVEDGKEPAKSSPAFERSPRRRHHAGYRLISIS